MDTGGPAANDGNPIVVGGATFAKGLGVHALAEVVFDLHGAHSRFTSAVGISDTWGNNGSVVFQVFADGAKIYDSGLLTGADDAVPMDVLIGGVQQLRLVVTAGPDGAGYDHAVWADAQFVTEPAPPGPPAAPGNLAADAVSSSLVKLTWLDHSNSETGVRVERSTNGSPFVPIATLNNVNERDYDDTDVAPLTAYAYRVVAFNADGDSAPSAAASASTPAPPPPENFLSDVAFAWASNGWGPVERDMDTGGPAANDGNPLVIGGVSYAKGLGVHAASDVAFNLGGDYARFAAAAGMSDTYGNNGTVVFQVFADGTKVYDSGIVTGAQDARLVDVDVTGVNQLRLVVTDGGDGNAYDHAAWGNARVATPPLQPGPPDAPTDLGAVVVSSSLVKLAWDDGANETGFRVERSADGSAFTTVATLPVNDRDFDDAGVSPSTAYTYRVVAFNADGDAPSATASASTPAPPPPSDFLSDLPFASSTNGWGPVERDTAVGGQAANDGNPIVINGVAYAKGLGVHAPSQIVFDFNGGYTRLRADLGIADGYASNGSVVFQVFADEAKVYESPLITGASDALSIDVDVEGASQVRLVVTPGPDGIAFDHAVWADARAEQAGPPQAVAPNAPTAVVAVGATDEKINLTWRDRSNDESSFKVERSTNGTDFVEIATVPANRRAYADAGLDPSATYVYRVRASNAHGDSAPSGVAAGTTLPPSAFLSDLMPTAVVNGWGPVERDMDTGGPAANDGNPLVIGGVSYAKGLGVHAASDVAFNLGGDYVRFAAAAGMSDTYGNNGTVVFQVFADGTKVYDSGIVTGAQDARLVDVDVTGVNQLRLVVTDGGDGNAYDHAAWGNARVATPPLQPGPPDAPTDLGAVVVSSSLVKLAWDDGANETGFRVERSADGSAFATVATLPVNDRDFDDAGVSPSTAYTYRVVAFNADGDAPSATASASTPAPPPPSDFLSDLPFASSTNGWGPVERDTAVGGQAANDGNPIVINGVAYAKGLGVHAPSQIVFDFNGGYTRLRADLGIADGYASNGSVVFQVFADEAKVYESPLITGASDALSIDVDVEGASQVRLVVTPGPDGIAFDHAVWADARAEQAGPPQAVAPNAPTAVVAVGATDERINLTWRDRSNDESSFKVERSTNGTDFVEIATVPANRRAYADAGLDPSATYVYRVRASNAHGDSAPSGVAAGTTLPPSAFLSDLMPTAVVNGWGPVERDMDTGGPAANDGNPLVIGGVSYAKGLGVHAASDVTFNLDGKFVRFNSAVGMSDTYGNNGTVVFQVFADGTKVYDSGLMTGAVDARLVDVDVTGVQELRLVVTSGGDGIAYDHAVWGGARVAYAPETAATPRTPLNFQAVATSATSVHLTWHDVSAIEDGFRIERSTDGVNFTEIAVLGRNVRQYTDLSANTMHGYAYRVVAYNEAGNSDPANPVIVMTPPNPADVVYLSDLPFASAVNQLGPVERDQNNGGAAAGDGATIKLDGVSYAKGLGVHGNSEVTFNLGGNYARFLSDIGVDDAITSHGQGMLVFRVYGDGVELYNSGTMTSDTATKSIDVSVVGINVLKLVVVDAGDGTPNDLADWAKRRAILASPGVPLYPATPLSALATPSGNVQLSWSDTATNEQGFRILRSTNGVDFAEIATVAANTTTYTDTTAVAQVKYTYRVAAFNASGASPPSFGAVAVTGVTYLSDLPFVSEFNGWGPVERDMETGEKEAGDGRMITLNDVKYAKGIGQHPTSSDDPPAAVVFNLGGNYARFQSDIGVDDRVGILGSVVFKVYADGVLIFESGVLTGLSATQSIDLNVAGVQELKLVVTNGNDGHPDDHAVWAGARLV